MKVELKRHELIGIKIALKHAQFGTPHSEFFQIWKETETKIHHILKNQKNERNSKSN